MKLSKCDRANCSWEGNYNATLVPNEGGYIAKDLCPPDRSLLEALLMAFLKGNPEVLEIARRLRREGISDPPLKLPTPLLKRLK